MRKCCLFPQGGFTLLELLITLALISTLAFLSVPTYPRWFIHFQQEITARRLLGALQFARSMAILRHTIVSVCKNHNNAGDWAQGWTVLADRPGTAPAILHRYPPLEAQQTLSWRSAGHKQYPQFEPTGTSLGKNGHFVLCSRRPESKIAWLIYISATGRIRLEKSYDLSQCKK